MRHNAWRAGMWPDLAKGVNETMNAKSPASDRDPRALLQRMLDPSSRPYQYLIYEQIREHEPLQLPEANLTVFSRYQDCAEVLRHSSASSDLRRSSIKRRQTARSLSNRKDRPAFLFLDPPDHTRLRKLISKTFVPRVVTTLEPFITELVDSVLDRIAKAGQFDAVTDLAYPVPVTVICRLLGVPIEDEPEFRQAAGLTARALDPAIALDPEGSAGLIDLERVGVWLREYLHALVKRRRSKLSDDLISDLIATEESGDQLTDEEIVSTCNLLLVAGHETTVSLIGNAILAMLSHPPSWAALASDSQRAPAFVEETLRFDSPLHFIPRVAADDMTIGDTNVTKGDEMMLLLASANRDPLAFDRPDTFDPNRESTRHLGFGHGPHFCLGAPVARLEARIALSAITKRFPHAKLAGEPQYKPNFTMRGLSSLPVKL
jgi:cytochrome P450